MQEFLQQCLIVCPLIFLAGFVDSVAGGGGLISLPAYLFVGIPTHIAAGTNKVVNGVGTFFAAAKYIKSGKVELRSAVWAALGALVGAALGARLALFFSEAALKTIILLALPCAAVFLTVKKDFGDDAGIKKRDWSAAQSVVLSILIGMVLGCYDGLIGPGTGTFMIMAFTAVLGMNLLTASGCAKVANLASNVASAVVWMWEGKVLWALALPAAACSVLGNICGARYAIRGGSKKVRGMIFVVLGLLFIKLGWELFF